MVLSINTSLVDSPNLGLEEQELGSFPHSSTIAADSSFDHALWNRLTSASSRFVHGDAAVIAGSVTMGLLFSTAASALLPATIAGGLAAMGVGVLANSLGGVVGGEIVLSLLHCMEPDLFISAYQLYASHSDSSLDELDELVVAYGKQWMASALMSFVLGSAAGRYSNQAAKWATSSNQLAALAGKTSQRIANSFESTRGSFANKAHFETWQEVVEHFSGVVNKYFEYAVSILTGGGRSRQGTVDREQGQKAGLQIANNDPRTRMPFTPFSPGNLRPDRVTAIGSGRVVDDMQMTRRIQALASVLATNPSPAEEPDLSGGDPFPAEDYDPVEDESEPGDGDNAAASNLRSSPSEVVANWLKDEGNLQSLLADKPDGVYTIVCSPITSADGKVTSPERKIEVREGERSLSNHAHSRIVLKKDEGRFILLRVEGRNRLLFLGTLAQNGAIDWQQTRSHNEALWQEAVDAGVFTRFRAWARDHQVNLRSRAMMPPLYQVLTPPDSPPLSWIESIKNLSCLAAVGSEEKIPFRFSLRPPSRTTDTLYLHRTSSSARAKRRIDLDLEYRRDSSGRGILYPVSFFTGAIRADRVALLGRLALLPFDWESIIEEQLPFHRETICAAMEMAVMQKLGATRVRGGWTSLSRETFLNKIGETFNDFLKTVPLRNSAPFFPLRLFIRGCLNAREAKEISFGLTDRETPTDGRFLVEVTISASDGGFTLSALSLQKNGFNGSLVAQALNGDVDFLEDDEAELGDRHDATSLNTIAFELTRRVEMMNSFPPSRGGDQGEGEFPGATEMGRRSVLIGFLFDLLRDRKKAEIWYSNAGGWARILEKIDQYPNNPDHGCVRGEEGFNRARAMRGQIQNARDGTLNTNEIIQPYFRIDEIIRNIDSGEISAQEGFAQAMEAIRTLNKGDQFLTALVGLIQVVRRVQGPTGEALVKREK